MIATAHLFEVSADAARSRMKSAFMNVPDNASEERIGNIAKGMPTPLKYSPFKGKFAQKKDQWLRAKKIWRDADVDKEERLGKLKQAAGEENLGTAANRALLNAIRKNY